MLQTLIIRGDRHVAAPSCHTWPLFGDKCVKMSQIDWPLAAVHSWPLFGGQLYSVFHRGDSRLTVVGRWPLFGGDRSDRFDCISTNFMMTSCFIQHHISYASTSCAIVTSLKISSSINDDVNVKICYVCQFSSYFGVFSQSMC